MEKAKLYIKSILVPVIIGGLVGWIISPSIDYNSLRQPPLSPSSKVFPIMWTILYIIMGISYGILKDKDLVEDKVSQIYYLQLFVNAMWSIIFFTFKWRLLAGIWIVWLAVLVGIMIYRFYNKNKTAGLLQVPYLLWVLFATYLNFGVWYLNR